MAIATPQRKSRRGGAIFGDFFPHRFHSSLLANSYSVWWSGSDYLDGRFYNDDGSIQNSHVEARRKDSSHFSRRRDGHVSTLHGRPLFRQLRFALICMSFFTGASCGCCSISIRCAAVDGAVTFQSQGWKAARRPCCIEENQRTVDGSFRQSP